MIIFNADPLERRLSPLSTCGPGGHAVQPRYPAACRAGARAGRIFDSSAAARAGQPESSSPPLPPRRPDYSGTGGRTRWFSLPARVRRRPAGRSARPDGYSLCLRHQRADEFLEAYSAGDREDEPVADSGGGLFAAATASTIATLHRAGPGPSTTYRGSPTLGGYGRQPAPSRKCGSRDGRDDVSRPVRGSGAAGACALLPGARRLGRPYDGPGLVATSRRGLVSVDGAGATASWVVTGPAMPRRPRPARTAARHRGEPPVFDFGPSIDSARTVAGRDRPAARDLRFRATSRCGGHPMTRPLAAITRSPPCGRPPARTGRRQRGR